MKLIPSEEMALIAEKVIRDVPELNWLQEREFSIGFYYSEKTEKSKGLITNGECRIPTGVYESFVPYDFIIIFYASATYFTQKQKEILMEHELSHIGIKNGKRYIVPHDFTDFKSIVDKYGSRWAEEVEE